jgi:hypothetical protein
MRRSSSRQLLIVLLGALFALGTGLAAVQAGSMDEKMAMTSDMGAPGDDHCGACNPGNGDDNGAVAAAPCAPICAPSATAVLPPTTTARAIKTTSLTLPDAPPRRSTAFGPDPYPPRSSDLG